MNYSAPICSDLSRLFSGRNSVTLSQISQNSAKWSKLRQAVVVKW